MSRPTSGITEAGNRSPQMDIYNNVPVDCGGCPISEEIQSTFLGGITSTRLINLGSTLGDRQAGALAPRQFPLGRRPTQSETHFTLPRMYPESKKKPSPKSTHTHTHTKPYSLAKKNASSWPDALQPPAPPLQQLCGGDAGAACTRQRNQHKSTNQSKTKTNG